MDDTGAAGPHVSSGGAREVIVGHVARRCRPSMSPGVVERTLG